MLWSLRSQQLLCVCGTMRPLRHHWSSSGLIVVYLQSRQQTLQHVQKSLGVPRMDIWTRLFADRRLLSLEDHLALEEPIVDVIRSEEHTSELQSLMRTSYAVFCMTKKKQADNTIHMRTLTAYY